MFVKELSFWGIQAPHFGSQAKETALVENLPKRLVDFMKSEPSGLADNALNRWKQLGALKFQDIIDRSFEKVYYNHVKFGPSADNPDLIG